MRVRTSLAFAALLLGLPLAAQEAAPPMPEECLKHCREMAAARQEALAARKAATEKADAALKEAQAQLQAAQTARGDKKIAALEAALEKLVAFHESQREELSAITAGRPGAPAGMGWGRHHGGMMGCCGSDCPMWRGSPPPAN
jgi:hypothetical protein